MTSTEETDVDALSSSADATPQRQERQERQGEAEGYEEENLSREEQEKLPMTGARGAGDTATVSGEGGGDAGTGSGGAGDGDQLSGGDGGRGEVAVAETNGSVKLKIPDDEEDEDEDEEEAVVQFTGLNKEQLMKVAGTPGWVRTRWALLILFWIGWLGMLAGAILIIVQAPRCRELPSTNWWNDGPLYQIGDVQAFTDTGNLKGLEEKVYYLSQLKVTGLVVGPLHVAPPDDDMGLSFEDVSPDVGTLQQFRSFLRAAHRRGLYVVLDLTPNYHGSSGPWFSNVSVTNVAERLKSALVFWLNEGVDGIQLDDVERVSTVAPSLWSDIRAIVQNQTHEHTNNRALIGITDRSSDKDVSLLLSSSGVDLLISRILLPLNFMERAQSVQRLYLSHGQHRLVWNVGGWGMGHMMSLVGAAQVKLHQLLVLTLPGTPAFNYGDEIGLLDQDTRFPRMLWAPEDNVNDTLKEQWAGHASALDFFKSISGLRAKERSLLFGDFLLLSNTSSSMAYLREWDQSTRFVAAFNWAEEEEAEFQLISSALPVQATVVVSTNSSVLLPESNANLKNLRLGPGQAVLLKFPYPG